MTSCLSLALLVVSLTPVIGADNLFQILRNFLANNDSDIEGVMAKLQQQGAKGSNASEDYDETEWRSDKGKSVMRLPPWTRSDSRAKDLQAAPIVAAVDVDYDAEESFERIVTKATSPDPWATGTIRSPATGEEDGTTEPPTQPMNPEFPESPAADSLLPKKPFTRKGGKATKNFIKFTKSATGKEWGRVTRNVIFTTVTKTWKLKTPKKDAVSPEFSESPGWGEKKTTATTDVRFEDTTLSNATDAKATTDFENNPHPFTFAEYEGPEESETEETSTATTVNGGSGAGTPGVNPADQFPEETAPPLRTKKPKKNTPSLEETSPSFETTSLSSEEATFGSRGRRITFPADEFAPTFPPGPATSRDEFFPRRTVAEPDQRQFGGEFLPPEWGKQTTSSPAPTTTQVADANWNVKDSENGGSGGSDAKLWLLNIFAKRKVTTTVPTEFPSKRTRGAFTPESTTFSASRPTRSETTLKLTTVTVTEGRVEEPEVNDLRRKRKTGTEKEIPFGFFNLRPFFKSNSSNSTVEASILKLNNTTVKILNVTASFMNSTKWPTNSSSFDKRKISVDMESKKVLNTTVQMTKITTGAGTYLGNWSKVTLKISINASTVKANFTEPTEISNKTAFFYAKTSTTTQPASTAQETESTMELPVRKTRAETQSTTPMYIVTTSSATTTDESATTSKIEETTVQNENIN